jgi:stage II sporulation protein AA (anti-sigma F factor antagonist)
VVLSGELDLSVRGSLSELLRPAEDADDAIIDLSGVTYLDSTALTCLIHVKNRLIQRGGGKVYLAGLRPQVRRIFEITHLDRIFEIIDIS